MERDSNIHQHSFPFREFVRVSLRFLVVVHGNSQLVFQHRQHWSESWSELTNIPLLFIDPIVSKGQHDIDLLFCWLSCVPCLQLFFHVWIPNCRQCILSCRDLSIGISIIFSLIFFIFSILDTIQYYSIQFKT